MKNYELLKEKNFILNMVILYLLKFEINFVCFVKVCVDVVKIFLIDIFFDQIKLDDFYYKIKLCVVFLVENGKFVLD